MARQRRNISDIMALPGGLHRYFSGKSILKACAIAACGLASFVFYFYIYTNVLGLDTPKMLTLRDENKRLLAQIEMLEQEIASQDERLAEIQRRDNIVYRPVFGMDEIPDDVRSAGFGGTDRYERYKVHEHGDVMASAALKMDILSKKTCIQSRSFDDVELLAKRAGDMASCVPSLNPVAPKTRNSISSPFGYRVHPIKKHVIFHEGIDFRGERGEPVYATGDGTVESVSHAYFGYGTCVVIDHGFGYKTRYAHLNRYLVQPGQKVTRGEQIATMGNTGQSTGNHLHYEVMYKGRHINPWNFIDMDITMEEYGKYIIPAQGGRI